MVNVSIQCRNGVIYKELGIETAPPKLTFKENGNFIEVNKEGKKFFKMRRGDEANRLMKDYRQQVYEYNKRHNHSFSFV